MPAPVSVVIPTLNSTLSMETTLASLVEGVHAGLVREVIFADGGSKDDIRALAEASGARLIRTERAGRGHQLIAGASVARGDWYLFLHADTELGRDWPQAVKTHLRNPDAAGYFRLRFDETGLFPVTVAAWANLRSRIFRMPYGDQGLLIHRQLYESIGGYPDQSLMEDVVICRRIGRRLTGLSAEAVTSADRYVRDGWLRRGSRNLATLVLYLFGRDPERLRKFYLRN